MSNNKDKVLTVIAEIVGVSFIMGCELPLGSTNNSGANPIPKISPVIATLDVAGQGGVVADSRGNIFYLNGHAGTVVRVKPDGSQNVFASYGGPGGYATIAIDKNDFIYVGSHRTIVKISPSGEIAPLGSEGGIAWQMTIDLSGNVYYSETTQQYVAINIIKKVTPAGVVSTFAGSATAGNSNGNGTSASFNNPQSLVTDSKGNIYVVDAGNYLIRKISPLGDVTTLAGSGAQAVVDGDGPAASFYFSAGVAPLTIDSFDNLYVSDLMFHTGYIRKITPSGSVTTYCGNGSSTAINVPGACDLTGVWGNMGLTVGPNGAIYFVSGRSLFRLI